MARVEALPTMCVAHGICVKLAPEVFQLEYGCVDVHEPEIDDADTELIARARKAVYRCPAKALLISKG